MYSSIARYLEIKSDCRYKQFDTIYHHVATLPNTVIISAYNNYAEILKVYIVCPVTEEGR